jgi:hypothetical protein
MILSYTIYTLKLFALFLYVYINIKTIFKHIFTTNLIYN